MRLKDTAKWIAAASLGVIGIIAIVDIVRPKPTSVETSPVASVIEQRRVSLADPSLATIVIDSQTYFLISVAFANPTRAEWINPQTNLAVEGLADQSVLTRCSGWRRDGETFITNPWRPGAALVIPAEATLAVSVLCDAPSLDASPLPVLTLVP
jgi:hypothetical protein